MPKLGQVQANPTVLMLEHASKTAVSRLHALGLDKQSTGTLLIKVNSPKFHKHNVTFDQSSAVFTRKVGRYSTTVHKKYPSTLSKI
jgi:hypothetical protein